jgi:hypothetical protein
MGFPTSACCGAPINVDYDGVRENLTCSECYKTCDIPRIAAEKPITQVDTPRGRQIHAEAINIISSVAEHTFGQPMGTKQKYLRWSVRDQFAIDVIDELNRQGWLLYRNK